MAEKQCNLIKNGGGMSEGLTLLDSSSHYDTTFTVGDLRKYDAILVEYQIANASLGSWVIPKNITSSYKETVYATASYKGRLEVTVTDWSTGSIRVSGNDIAGWNANVFTVIRVYGIKF